MADRKPDVAARRAARQRNIRRKFPSLKQYVDSPFFETLPQRWPKEPTLAEPVSQLCTGGQIEDPNYKRVCAQMKVKPVWHRKFWEFAYIARCLEAGGYLKEGKKGLGFGVGTERLPSYFASQGCHIVGTDLPVDQLGSIQWDKSDQHASSRDAMFNKTLIDRATFDERCSFEPVDMRAISPSLRGFDFCWSACALEHLGSISEGLRFIRSSLDTLAPGGMAVHTTEFNLGSADETLEDGPCVVFREKDIVKFAEGLRDEGFKIDLNLNPGSHALDRFVDAYRTGDPHLRIYVRHKVLATSVGLQIRKPG